MSEASISIRALDRVGMSPLRTFFLVLTLPFALAAVLLGLGWIGLSSVVSGEPTLATIPTPAWVTLASGIGAVALISYLRRGAGALVRVLRTRPHAIAAVQLARQRYRGVESGRVEATDADGKLLAIMMVNDTRKLDVVRSVLTAHAPHARIEDRVETTRSVDA